MKEGQVGSPQISRFHFVRKSSPSDTQNSISAETIIESFDQPNSLAVYPYVSSSDTTWKVGKTDSLTSSMELEIQSVDKSLSSWKTLAQFPESLRPRSEPKNQLSIIYTGWLHGKKTSNIAYPCSAFSTEVKNAKVNRLAVELNLLRSTYIIEFGGGLRGYPQSIRLPLEVSNPNEEAISNSHWCSVWPTFSSDTSTRVNIIHFKSDNTIKSGGLEGSSIDRKPLSKRLGFRSKLTEKTWSFQNGEMKFSQAKEEDLFERNSAKFFQDSNKNLMLILMNKKHESFSSEFDVYFQCSIFLKADAPSVYKFNDLDWTSVKSDDPFGIGEK